MATPYDLIAAAWNAPNRDDELNRVVEVMAAEGVTLEELNDALRRLLLEVRAAGADDDTEEIINCVGDRLHGWCHENWHIKTQPSPVIPPTVTNGLLDAPHTPTTPTESA